MRTQILYRNWTTTHIVIPYLAAALLVVVAMPSLRMAVTGMAVCFVGAILHAVLYSRRMERMPWGELALPFWIVDWGEDGRNFQLPAHLDGQYIPTSSDKVDELEQLVRNKLVESNNYLYVSWPKYGTNFERLPVMKMRFRFVEDVNESQTQYVDRVVREMEKLRQEWFDELFHNPNVDPNWIINTFHMTRAMGSAPN